MRRGACMPEGQEPPPTHTHPAEVRDGSEPPNGVLGPGLRSSARTVGSLDQ